MGTWDHDLSADERAEWERFVEQVREGTVKQMARSAFVISLVPKGEPDIKFAVELGLAIMLDKPIIAVAAAGADVPRRLRELADGIIEVDDIDTEAGQLALRRQLAPFLDGLR